MNLKFYKSGRSAECDVYKQADGESQDLWLRISATKTVVQWQIQKSLSLHSPAKGTILQILNHKDQTVAYTEHIDTGVGFAAKAYPFSWEQEEAPCTTE